MTTAHRSAIPDRMLVLGHRGAISDRLPFSQNSLRAFEEAVEGGDGFETDAVADKDGEVFLVHEAKYIDPAKGVEYCMGEYLDEASAKRLGARRLDQLGTEEMRALRLKDGAPLPTLRQALELVAGKPEKLLNIELKGFESAGPVLKLVKEYLQEGVQPEQLLISAFNHPALEIVRRDAPEIAIGALFIGADQISKPIFPWRPESDGVYTSLTAAALDEPLLRRLKPDYIIMPEYVLNLDLAHMIAACFSRARLGAWVFTERGGVDMQELIVRLKQLQRSGKIAAMVVDNPREFMKAFES